MANIKKIKEGTATIYPATIPQAVVDPTSGKTVRMELDEKADQTELDQLARDVNELGIKDAVQGAKIKDIENVLSTANFGQSAKISASGRKVVSLPKNAANSGMSVKLEGLTAENLITNGDFRNGTTGWELIGAPVITITDNIATLDPNIAGAGIWSDTNFKIDNTYYFRLLVKGTMNFRLRVGTAGTVEYQTQYIAYPDWSTFTYQQKMVNNDVDLLLLGNTGIQFQLQRVQAINLTETFGAGNEPTKEQCDLIFSDYFDGVKSFEPTGRVRSVGKNLLTGRYIDGSRINESTGFTTPSSPSSRTDYFKISANKQYILEANDNSTANHIIAFYNANKTFIIGHINAANSHLVVTSPSNAVYAMVSTLTTTKDTLRLSAGAIRIPYEPYRETSLYLTSPELRSNGAVKDEIRKGANGYELVKRISDIDGTVLATPVISPVSYGGILNSAANGTVYHEPVIADAGVYGTKMDILLTDYPIASIEEIIKHEDGVDTYLNVATAVIAGDKLSFTHPSLQSGDLVLFTYAFSKETTNGNITATFYDSNVVKIDTVTGKAYKINEVVTNGVLTRTLTEV